MSGGTYNTKGKVVGQSPSSGKPAAASNPELTELDALQLLLDLAGMIPGAGAVPDLLNAAISAAKGDYIGAALSVLSAVPGAGDVAGAAKIAKNADKYAKALVVVETKVLPKLPASVAKPIKAFIDKAKQKIEEIKGPKKDAPEDKKTKEETPKKEPEPANGGKDTQVKGSGDGDDDCGIKPYKDQKCAKGQQAHHIVPDYALRYGTRDQAKRGEGRIPGMPSIDDGPSICLGGQAKTQGSDHNKAHEGTDPRIVGVGNDVSKGPLGTAPIGEILDIAIEEVGKVKPHCKEQIKAKVDEAFKDVDRNKYGRTTQQPPAKGSDVRNTLENGKKHNPEIIKRKRK
jgi:hypothetical protein